MDSETKYTHFYDEPVKHTEFAAFGVLAYHRLVIAGGQACDLEFDIALVGPEPRDARVFFGAAHQRISSNFGVFDRIIDRFQADALGGGGAGYRVGHIGHVAGHDAVVDLAPKCLG